MANSTDSSFINTLRGNPFGWEYTERSKLGLDHFKFEEIDLLFWIKFIQESWTLPFYLTPIYFGVVFGLQKWMKGKKPLKLDKILLLWNLFLGIFSVFGLIRATPGLLEILWRPGGFHRSICERNGAIAELGFWTLMYCLSKILELGDTVFLVLRKKPLTFLHVSHHSLTMAAVWLAVPYTEPVAWLCMVLNYAELSLLYPYFVLKSFNVKMPIMVPNMITTFQFLVMVWGAFIQGYTIYLYEAGYNCSRHPFSIKVCFSAAISLVFLFGKQFLDFVVMKGREKKEAKLQRKKQ